jgi:hypothetical protein
MKTRIVNRQNRHSSRTAVPPEHVCDVDATHTSGLKAFPPKPEALPDFSASRPHLRLLEYTHKLH